MSLASVLHELVDVASGRQTMIGDADALHAQIRSEFGEAEPRLELTDEEAAKFAAFQAQQAEAAAATGQAG